uniref:FecR family protein n=1 Tax=Cellulophaga fucicola TaxID=76595 RepID=UPI003EBBAF7F
LYDGSIQGVGESSEDGVIKDQHGKIVGRQKNDKIIYSVTAADTEVASIKINTIRVPNGKKFQLFLSDGTEIYINSGSVIKFPSAIIPGKLRQVELEGEAFFKVAKNREDAFVVRTKGISTEVFGTQFNVSSYGGDSFAKVVLLEGSVGVFSGKDRFNEKEDHYLKPNQMAVYQNDIEGIDVREVTAEDYIAWVDGALLFKNESFENIMKKLERHYNIEIDVAYEDIKNEKFTGYFDIESIENVLNTFKENTPFSFQLNDNKLTINP